MKYLIILFKIIAAGLVIAFLPSGCNGGGVPDSPPPDENIVIISLMYYKTHYRVGETFDTSGNKLRMYYADYTYDEIDSGFTLEWSLEPDDGYYENRWEWYYDNSAWKPIRHGDILPVSNQMRKYLSVRPG